MVKLYQVYDTVGQNVLGPIITVKHDAAAVRIFTEALKDQKTALAQHPQDYVLLYLGTQDDDTGVIVSEMPKTVLTGKQWKDMQGDGAPSE